jgi:hypothetical protein
MEDFIWGFISGLTAAYWGYQWYRRRKLPYRWTCPESDCKFGIDTNDLETVDAFASAHEGAHI